MGKKLLAIAFCLAAFGPAAFCGSLSFQIVQHNDSLSDVCKSALIIEDEILNYFFDAGYIVTNVPAAMSSSAVQDEKLWQSGCNEAAGGSFDQFVQIHLYFNSSESKPERVALGSIDRVSWKVGSVMNGNIVVEGSRDVEKPMGADSERNVRGFAADFALYIQQILGSKA